MTKLLRANAGLWLWAVAFSALYAFHGIGCSQGWDKSMLAGISAFQWMMAAIWLMFIIGGIAIIWWASRQKPGQYRCLTMILAIVGLAGIVITGLPVLLASECL